MPSSSTISGTAAAPAAPGSSTATLLPNNQENFVSAAQLSQVTYRGGGGTETIYERASDGILFSAWVSVNATGTDTAPVVTPVHSR